MSLFNRKAAIDKAAADRTRLTRTAYNLGAFNPSAEEIRDEVLRAFPNATISWKNDRKRQGIVDARIRVDEGWRHSCTEGDRRRITTLLPACKIPETLLEEGGTRMDIEILYCGE